MSRFNLTLKHVPEVRIEKVDRLSKRPDLKVEIKNDNKNQKLIKEEWIRGIMKVVEKIKSAREKDKEVVRVVEEM